MRMMTIRGYDQGVTFELESSWADLEEQARRDAVEAGSVSPHIQFRTDIGVFGSIPVMSPSVATFGDKQPAKKYLGMIVWAGRAADDPGRQGLSEDR